ncbi:phage regulatory protein/antirepressor Ant [Romboutsia lituseburensis]|uniref:phage regulatory protein/antirepressor Ant n=1 Tax=Romboutsia lituseburensis TaxID=1537 RepID=UPI00215A7372|nr:phage regulatory protein/antirepressor Ant [Romboutsia lituseburensis]MCR8744500.1 phage regulatory protein/antirepressor Ant [Romboutsia lituseburensis]
MQQLISSKDIKIIEVNEVQVVSSREIASNFRKEHSKVIRSIEEIIEQMDTSSQNWRHLFIESLYEDSYKREQKEYLITKSGFSLLAMGFTGKKALQWKLKYIDTFNKMEQIIKDNLQQQIEVNEPLVIFARAVMKSSDTTDMNTFAKLLNSKDLKINGKEIGQKKLFAFLRDNGILMKNNQPYQIYVNRKYFKYNKVETPKGFVNQTVLLGKGEVAITKLIKKKMDEYELNNMTDRLA